MIEDVAVILAGGKGERLKPISTEENPKQFLPLLSNQSMLSDTIDRVTPVFGSQAIFICSAMKYISKVKKRPYRAILEPDARGTAYSVLYSVIEVKRKYGDVVIHVIPSDHYIGNLKKYHEALVLASMYAKNFDKIVLLGVKPTEPDCGYGYIKRKGNKVINFIEKPNQEMAKYFVEQGYLWNSGHIIFKASIMLKEFETFQPELLKEFSFFYQHRCLDAFYWDLTPINVEKAIIERSRKVAVIPSFFDWSDIGTLERLFKVWEGDEETYGEKIKTYKRINQ